MVNNIAILAQEIESHYQSRGFSKKAIGALLNSIGRSHKHGTLFLPGAVLRCDVTKLLGQFGLQQDAAPATREELQSASAIFAFSFGYRLKSGQGSLPAARLPGKNNRELAEIVADLHSQFSNVLLCAQFEIADALEDRDPPIPVHSRTPAEDWGTKAVLDYFLRDIGWRILNADNSVIVVAHAHHVGRCLILVGDIGLRGLLPSRSYAGYDRHEQQPRVKGEIAFIHSDFVSLVAAWSR
jgi:hypothetical protein